jgi:acyl carrier protein
MTLLTSPISEQDAIAAVTEVLDGRGADGTEIDPGTNLHDLGLDSLDLAELFMVLEELAGERLDPTSAGDVVLVGDLCNLRTLVTHHG